MTEIEALILLNGTDGFGPKAVRILLNKFGSAREAVHACRNRPDSAAGLGLKQPEAAGKIPEDGFAEMQLDRARELGAKIIPLGSAEYPDLLKQIYDPPVLLHVIGSLSAQDAPGVGIVGTRHPTLYGRRTAEALGGALARQGFTVVSGLALGIDAASHESALREKGRTLAVVGCGADCPYPNGNRELYHAIIENGAIISEFAFGTEPFPAHFPRRNRIISGLSKALAVVEAGEKSGALITAEFAMEQGREVFSVPGPIDSPQSRGTNRLIQQGAHPLLDPEELLEFLGRRSSAPRPCPPGPGIELDDGEKRVVEILSPEPVHIDEIVRRAEFPLTRLHPVLLSLQMKGCIRELPGMQYVRNRG